MGLNGLWSDSGRLWALFPILYAKERLEVEPRNETNVDDASLPACHWDTWQQYSSVTGEGLYYYVVSVLELPVSDSDPLHLV